MQMGQTDEEAQSHQMMQQQLSYENQIVMNDSQMKMAAVLEGLQNTVSTRYDDIYHPRTDKRVIRK